MQVFNKTLDTAIIGFAIMAVLILWCCSPKNENSKTAEPNLLIIEGWLESRYFNQVTDTLLDRQFNTILVTGTSLDSAVQLTENANSYFFVFPDKTTLTDTNQLTILLSGTPVNRVYPAFKIEGNAHVLLADTVSGTPSAYTVMVPRGIDTLQIRLTNDTYTSSEDRNLSIDGFIVNGNYIAARNHQSIYQNRTNSPKLPVYFQTHADQTAYYFREHLDSTIKVYAVGTTNVEYSRTLSSARDAICWMQNNNFSSAAIITADYHSHRTLLSYRKAAPSNFKLGTINVISADDSKDEKLYLMEIFKTIGLLFTPTGTDCRQKSHTTD